MNLTKLHPIARAARQIRELAGKKVENAATQKLAQEEARVFQKLLALLKHYGLGKKVATQVFRFYYLDSPTKIKANPYQLVMDIPGIGFKTADRIGRSLGLPLDAPARLDVGVVSQRY